MKKKRQKVTRSARTRTGSFRFKDNIGVLIRPDTQFINSIGYTVVMSYFSALHLVYLLSGITPLWYTLSLVYLLSGISPLRYTSCLVYLLSGIPPLWYTPSLVYPLFGIPPLWYTPSLVAFLQKVYKRDWLKEFV